MSPTISADDVGNLELLLGRLAAAAEGDSVDVEIEAAHDLAGLVADRILPGLAAGLRPDGGMGGLVLSYGDGCDLDTAAATLGKAVDGWVVDLTLTDGTQLTVWAAGLAQGDGEVVLRYHQFVDGDDEPTTPQQTIPFAQVAGLRVN